MIFRAVQKEEVRKWSQLCGAGFNGDAEYFYRHYINDPDADCDGIFVAEDETAGVLVSSVRVFVRKIYINGETVTMGGIGEVCTLPEYRRQGFSACLLQMAVEYMEQKGLCVSFLFTGVNAHYAKQGWFTVPRRYISLELENHPLPRNWQAVSAADVDISKLAAFYNKYAKNYTGVLVRSEEYFSRWLDLRHENQRVLLINGEIAAYAASHTDEHNILHFEEYTGSMEYFMPYFGSFGCKTMVRVPNAYFPKTASFRESMSLMARLNIPFGQITTPARLLSALSDTVFFGLDGF